MESRSRSASLCEIASSLSPILNIWIARELWHIFENIDLYLQKPELILSKKIIADEPSNKVISAKEELWYSLKKWETLRNQNDLSNLKLFWLGDSLRESLLPPNQNMRIFQHIVGQNLSVFGIPPPKLYF